MKPLCTICPNPPAILSMIKSLINPKASLQWQLVQYEWGKLASLASSSMNCSHITLFMRCVITNNEWWQIKSSVYPSITLHMKTGCNCVKECCENCNWLWMFHNIQKIKTLFPYCWAVITAIGDRHPNIIWIKSLINPFVQHREETEQVMLSVGWKHCMIKILTCVYS